MYVCVLTFPFGIFLQSGFVRTTFEKYFTTDNIYICIAVGDSYMQRGGLGDMLEYKN
jgi:hypothetical protein